MNLPLRQRLEEISILCGIEPEMIITFIEQEWIEPIDREHLMFDEEDLARVRLIKELKDVFEVNDEAVAVILHLVDQLNYLQLKLKL
jgi:chaperone modulatory protein CbpM